MQAVNAQQVEVIEIRADERYLITFSSPLPLTHDAATRLKESAEYIKRWWQSDEKVCFVALEHGLQMQLVRAEAPGEQS